MQYFTTYSNCTFGSRTVVESIGTVNTHSDIELNCLNMTTEREMIRNRCGFPPRNVLTYLRLVLQNEVIFQNHSIENLLSIAYKPSGKMDLWQIFRWGTYCYIHKYPARSCFEEALRNVLQTFRAEKCTWCICFMVPRKSMKSRARMCPI